MTQNRPHHELTNSAKDLTRIAQRARELGRIALDTEFLPEGRYRPLLCLVQIAVGDEIFLLDPIEGFDPAPIAGIIEDPDVEVILHAGRQDVAILRREWKIEFNNLFDTQVAAGFAGYSAQAGYTGLLNDVLQIRLAKTASFTRWDARPLTDEQTGYARDDVEHLLPLASEIQARLVADSRLEWALEECQSIAEASDERDPQDAWRRLSRVKSLNPGQRAVARELAAWRELTAQRENKPVGTVLKDPSVVELAKRLPKTRDDLAHIRGIASDVARRRGADIIAAVRRGNDAEPIRLPAGERLAVESRDRAVIALAEALLRARALEAGLAYELIASRADLNQIVVTTRRGDVEPEVRTLQGWRRQLVGDELLELLRGNVQLRVNAKSRLEIAH